MQDFSDLVLSLHTRKALGASAGSWEVQLRPNSDMTAASGITKDNFESVVYRMFRPMDVVLVGMNGQTIMQGFVDNVYKTKTQQNEGVQRTITIRGRDATKLFIEDGVASAPELAVQDNVKKLLGESATQFLQWIRGLVDNGTRNVFANGSIPEAMDWILTNIPSMSIVLDGVLQSKKSGDLFLRKIVAYEKDSILDEPLSIYAGKIINYLTQLVDEAFYEVWVDTIPAALNPAGNIDSPCLFVRPKPFDRSYEVNSDGQAPEIGGMGMVFAKKVTSGFKVETWDTLTCPIYGEATTLEESDILQKNLGVSDYDVLTMYKVVAAKDPLAVSELGKFGMYFPLIDGNMVRLYGLREIQAQSKMLPPMTNWFPPSLGGVGVTNDFPMSYFLSKVGEKIGGEEVFRGTLQRRDRFWRWNRYNHIYETGTITIGGRDVRVGSKVKLSDEATRGIIVDENRDRSPHQGMEFYCVSVDQFYQFGQNWTTALALTRGHNPEELKKYHDQRGFDKKAGDNGVLTVSYEQVAP